MKPIAAPVIGGMLSSLVAILIVTPVIFCWLREQELTNVEVPNAGGGSSTNLPAKKGN
jgi:Cu(I)/Ag(I) efflux system membrane protein CusA/SilA